MTAFSDKNGRLDLNISDYVFIITDMEKNAHIKDVRIGMSRKYLEKASNLCKEIAQNEKEGMEALSRI